MKWRIAEVTPRGALAFDARTPRLYEIQPVWESEVLKTYKRELVVPPDALNAGHTYRVRARMMDKTGRWSHWSGPVEFQAGAPKAQAPQQRSPRATEIKP